MKTSRQYLDEAANDIAGALVTISNAEDDSDKMRSIEQRIRDAYDDLEEYLEEGKEQ